MHPASGKIMFTGNLVCVSLLTIVNHLMISTIQAVAMFVQGLTYNSSTTLDHLADNAPDLAILVGDLTYADAFMTNGEQI